MLSQPATAVKGPPIANKILDNAAQPPHRVATAAVKLTIHTPVSRTVGFILLNASIRFITALQRPVIIGRNCEPTDTLNNSNWASIAFIALSASINAFAVSTFPRSTPAFLASSASLSRPAAPKLRNFARSLALRPRRSCAMALRSIWLGSCLYRVMMLRIIWSVLSSFPSAVVMDTPHSSNLVFPSPRCPLAFITLRDKTMIAMLKESISTAMRLVA